MIVFVTFSNPTKSAKIEFNKDVEKIKIKKLQNRSKLYQDIFQKEYFAEVFTKTQVFHEHFTEEEVKEFIHKNAGKTFKNCVYQTETEEVTILSNKKGKITELRKRLNEINPSITNPPAPCNHFFQTNSNRQKKYILKENAPVDFLIELGVMNKDGKVLSAKYNKFKQINRYLEFIDDVFEKAVLHHSDKNLPINIVDFGSGKSYLTFAVYYYFVKIKKVNVNILGLDLRSDVVEMCNEIANRLDYKNIVFKVGDVASYTSSEIIDMMITLHACDTATDYALQFAAKHNASVILSVPCCQHEVNEQLAKNTLPNEYSAFQKYGIIQERFASLVTDLCRADFLEQNGYKVQLLEFIDMEYTAKNILIRAVKKSVQTKLQDNATMLLSQKLNIAPKIYQSTPF